MTEAVYTATAEYIVEMEQRPVKHHVSVSGVLKHLGVSRSGYNAWKKRVPSATEKHRGEIKQKIRKIYEDSHQNYGAPKITRELWKTGEKIAVKTVANYMRQMGIKAQWVKPYVQTTIDSDFSSKLLTSIMDLYSRKIIAWVLGETLEASHVVECIEKAKKIRRIAHPLIIHTDRGCQYVSDAFRKATEGMVNSYSKKAYPWDNACIESFHALLKREWINRFKIFNYRHAYKLVFEYIETFYNTVRTHSHCGYLSPDQYEKEYYAALDERAEALAG